MAMKNITYKVPKNNKEVFVDPPMDYISDLVKENKQKIRNYTFKVTQLALTLSLWSPKSAFNTCLYKNKRALNAWFWEEAETRHCTARKRMKSFTSDGFKSEGFLLFVMLTS